MATLTIELPPQPLQTEFNLQRWAEVLADRELAKFEWRVETDRHGYVIMNPPPAPTHGILQSRIAHLLQNQLSHGRVLSECPISTADGVRATDVAWASAESIKQLGDHMCFTRAPEICIEVLSPSNTKAEIREKTALYFDAGAREVWLCSDSGAVTFFRAGEAQPIPASQICPDFPFQIELPPV